MQAPMTSVQSQYHHNAAKLLLAMLVNFVSRVFNLHGIGLLLMLGAPIALAFLYDSSEGARMFLAPISEYFPYPILIHWGSWLVMQATSSRADQNKAQRAHWLIRGINKLMVGLYALCVLYIFITYALAVLFIMPPVLWALSIVATFIILASLRSNGHQPDDEIHTQQELQLQQWQLPAQGNMARSAHYSQVPSYIMVPVQHSHLQNAVRYDQQPPVYYLPDE